jgi:hypothetical protein
VSLAVFVAALALFLAAPLRQASGDSAYTLVASTALLRDGTLAIERYVPPGAGNAHPLRTIRGHVYSFFPPGNAVLSVPAVVVAELLGEHVIDAHGQADRAVENRVSSMFAACLMAALVAFAFATARLFLDRASSLAVAAVTALGTSVLSTFSRGLWSQTWAVLLVAIAWFVALRRSSAVLVGSLLAWAYFTRPTTAIPALAIVLYLALDRRRRDALVASIVGALWLACFVVWSRAAFGSSLPPYYQPARLGNVSALVAFGGNVVSPSRGLFVFSPVIAWAIVAGALFLFRGNRRAIGVAALLACLGHLALMTSFEHWWGGASYGPRLSSDLVPSALVLSVWTLAEGASRLLPGALGAISAAMHLPGAVAESTWLWCDMGPSVEQREMWSWKRAQFLAPFVERRIPPPAEAPLLEDRLSFDDPISTDFVVVGFSATERTFRWTNARRASLAFIVADERAVDSTLTLKVSPFIAPFQPMQRISVRLDGRLIIERDLTAPRLVELSARIPGTLLGPTVHELLFELPEARSPEEMSAGSEKRRLGVAVHELAILPTVPR